ncbi:MAG TPA: efflux RND transporter periplasmic adaptor subunit [Bacteroidota bacterium]|nr:efflux RND transporter periplasmic adaptor subunit [Bacteroidota bacterium]
MANGKSLKSKKKIFIFSGIGAVILVLVLIVLLGSKRENVISVQTDQVVRKSITQIVTASGKIQPETAVKINAEVSGEIIELPVKEGQRVRKGDLLVRIKPDQYQAGVDGAAAALVSAKAALSLNQANLDKSESEYKRAQGLFEKKLMSDQDFVGSKTAFKVAQAQYESAVSGVTQAQASLNQAKESLAKTSIYAPMDGTVSQLISELGERVSGSSFTEGTEIMTVSDLSRMEARVDVGEDDVVLVAIGDTANIQVDAYPDRKLKGIVYEIANTATTTGAGTQDEVTNFQVKIRVLDKDIELRPGMSMSADIQTETRNNVLAVPIQSVTTRTPKMAEGKQDSAGKGNAAMAMQKPVEVVFVVKDGKAKQVPVKRGISDESTVEIISGLTETDQVVSGSYKAINRDLEDGSTVKVDNSAKRFGMMKKEGT